MTDVYKLDKRVDRAFKPLGSIAFDSCILSWKLDKNEVSIWTVDGRQRANLVCQARAKEILLGVRGEPDSCLSDGAFYLFTCCRVEEKSPKDVDGFLGVIWVSRILRPTATAISILVELSTHFDSDMLKGEFLKRHFSFKNEEPTP